MKLALLIPQFPGQTHNFFWREIRTLEAMGVEVHLFSTRPPPAGIVAHDWSAEATARTTYLGLGRLRDQLAALARLPGWIAALRRHDRSPAALRNLLISAPAAMAFRRHCRTRGLTAAHTHSAASSAMIAALAQLAGGPAYSLTLHGTIKDYGPAQRFKWGHAAFGIAITKRLQAQLVDVLGPHLPDRLYVCPMGVDTEDFRPEGTYAPWDGSGDLRLFTCARLNHIKGHDTAIHALAQLVRDGLRAHLTIAGEDDAGGSGYRRFLEKLIAQEKLEPHVTLLGAVDRNTVLHHLHRSHIFVLASRNDALGVAYMEAMACEIPTIGAEAGGVPDLIRDGIDGLLVPPDDPAALAGVIERLARDSDLAVRLSGAGRARVLDGFRAEQSAEALVRGHFQPR